MSSSDRGKSKKGDRQILVNILESEPRNELAWLWMSRAVDTKKQQHQCLQKVLSINPDNETAQKVLTRLNYQTPSPTKKNTQVRTKTAPAKPSPPMTPQEVGRLLMIGGGVAGGLILIILIGILVMQQLNQRQEVAVLADVCRGKQVSGTARYQHNLSKHPAVGFSLGSGGWYLDNAYIPREARAQSLEETQLVLCMGKVEDIFIESCPYTHVNDRTGPIIGKIDRYYYKQQAKLIEPGTGRRVSVQAFTGKSARMCKDIERLPTDGSTVVLKGTHIPKADVRDWVEDQVLE